MKIYFDIGNTNIKLNFSDGVTEYYHNFNTSIQYTVDTLFKELPSFVKKADIESVSIVSVVPRQEEVIIGMVKKYWSINPFLLKFPIKTKLKVTTMHPKKVGPDLISLASYVANKTSDGIIVNLGTTTTIMHVLNCEMTGALICPGLESSLAAIVNSSSLIGEIKLLENIGDKFMGCNTQEAISIGVIRSHVGAIKYIVENISKDADLFISGGHARKIMKYLPEFKFVKEATIEGLKIIKEYNETPN